jgi:GntR family transcriptional regulator
VRWRPGEALPSEFQLAAELGVSQGTVRKALDSLAREGLVIRHQGRGTYVVEHDKQQALFRFFHLVADGHERELPDSRLLNVSEAKATSQERQRLFMDSSIRVVRIERRRFLNQSPVIAETVIVPKWLIGNASKAENLPNTLYRYYQLELGVTVARAIEKLRAIAATDADAELLAVAPGSPLLEIDRVAEDLQGRAIEWRVSRCRTEDYYYLSESR